MPDTRWFDVAAFTTLWAVLVIVFGRFEQHKPAWRRLLKFALLLALLLGLVELAGRGWAYAVLGLFLAAGGAIHFTVLSNRGINGWTGEPREKLEALLHEIEERGEARALWHAVSGAGASRSRHTPTR
jgi:hypothetical protein